MKHIFILNPAAGKENAKKALEEQLKNVYSNVDYEIYETRGRGDAIAYIKQYCESNRAPVRFYACGGDGTLNEVVNGAVGYPHASVGCIPCGSGNDFVKYYGGKENFMDIPSLMDADEVVIDAMRVADHYSVNVTNFGFDTKVCVAMEKYRHKRFIGGKNAYTAALVTNFFSGMRTKVKVDVDNETVHDGDILLCTVANAQYIGGAYRCAPFSSNTDGYLDVCLVKPIGRIGLLKLIKVYERGEHLNDPRFKDLIVYHRAKSLHIEGEADFCITVDGETFASPTVDIEILPRSIRMALPEKAKQSVCFHEGKPCI